MDKQLKDKAIDIKGKDYVLVSDRVLFFNEEYPNGSIQTEIVKYEDKHVLIKATITPDCSKPERFFTGYAQEIEGSTFINKTSALENAETSAVGRALAMMGIGVIDSIASVDEINKANNRPKTETRSYPTKGTIEVSTENCDKCGSKLLTSKAGNKYCKCWYKDDTLKTTTMKANGFDDEPLPEPPF